MSTALFEFDDFAPEHAADCAYCHVLPSGRWTCRSEHDREHAPIQCEYCGAISANRARYERDHGRGRTWTRFGHTRPVCTSLQLRINQGRIDAAPYLTAAR